MPLPDPTTDLASLRYRRLPGRTPSFRLVSNASSHLWLGDDHLLQVQISYFSEAYKRFAYGDIQALLLRETARGLMTTLLLGAFAAGGGLLAWGMDDETARWIFVGLGGFFFGLFAVNLSRGKTCRCHLQTAVGPHALPSLSRVRPARKALRLITERVEAAQGVQRS